MGFFSNLFKKKKPTRTFTHSIGKITSGTSQQAKDLRVSVKPISRQEAQRGFTQAREEESRRTPTQRKERERTIRKAKVEPRPVAQPVPPTREPVQEQPVQEQPVQEQPIQEPERELGFIERMVETITGKSILEAEKNLTPEESLFLNNLRDVEQVKQTTGKTVLSFAAGGKLLKLGGKLLSKFKTVKKITKVAKSKNVASGKLTESQIRDRISGIPVNTANQKTSLSWLRKLVESAKAHPGTTAITTGVAVSGGVYGTVKGINEIIGQYNFADFIGEEALQTVGFTSSVGITAAEDLLEEGQLTADDVFEATSALSYEYELLEPDIWTGIIDATPQKKTIDAFTNFQKAALIAANSKAKRLQTLEDSLSPEEQARLQSLLGGEDVPIRPDIDQEQPINQEQETTENSGKWKESANGGFEPNLDNPLWIKENGRNVWTG